MLDYKDRLTLTKFRCGNHRLPINTLRYASINSSNRYCSLCENQEIGDEYHYLFNCTFFIEERKKYPQTFLYK